MTHNGQGLLQGWNSMLVRPEPLLNKDIKVQVNKQKPNNVRPAQMKHNSDKMTIAPTSSQPCSKPNVVRSPFSSVIYNVGLCPTAECCLCVGTRQALLQGWLLCVGFVCLANVPDLVGWLSLNDCRQFFK
jgi:hypothetical protein